MNTQTAIEKAIQLQKKQIERTEKLKEMNKRLADPNGSVMKNGLQAN